MRACEAALANDGVEAAALHFGLKDGTVVETVHRVAAEDQKRQRDAEGVAIVDVQAWPPPHGCAHGAFDGFEDRRLAEACGGGEAFAQLRGRGSAFAPEDVCGADGAVGDARALEFQQGCDHRDDEIVVQRVFAERGVGFVQLLPIARREGAFVGQRVIEGVLRGPLDDAAFAQAQDGRIVDRAHGVDEVEARRKAAGADYRHKVGARVAVHAGGVGEAARAVIFGQGRLGVHVYTCAQGERGAEIFRRGGGGHGDPEGRIRG